MRGTKWRSQPRKVRQWPEPSLLCADGWCCDAKPRAATQLRTAVQRGLDRFSIMGGKAPRAPGGDTFIAGRRLARCRAIPLSGWVVAEALLTLTAAALRRPGGHISSRSDTAFSPIDIPNSSNNEKPPDICAGGIDGTKSQCVSKISSISL